MPRLCTEMHSIKRKLHIYWIKLKSSVYEPQEGACQDKKQKCSYWHHEDVTSGPCKHQVVLLGPRTKMPPVCICRRVPARRKPFNVVIGVIKPVNHVIITVNKCSRILNKNKLCSLTCGGLFWVVLESSKILILLTKSRHV